MWEQRRGLLIQERCSLLIQGTWGLLKWERGGLLIQETQGVVRWERCGLLIPERWGVVTYYGLLIQERWGVVTWESYDLLIQEAWGGQLMQEKCIHMNMHQEICGLWIQGQRWEEIHVIIDTQATHITALDLRTLICTNISQKTLISVIIDPAKITQLTTALPQFHSMRRVSPTPTTGTKTCIH